MGRPFRAGAFVLFLLAAAGCAAERATAPADPFAGVPGFPVTDVAILTGRWRSAGLGLVTTWTVDPEGAVQWVAGGQRGTARLTLQGGRVLYAPASGAPILFTYYVLPSKQRLLRAAGGLEMRPAE